MYKLIGDTQLHTRGQLLPVGCKLQLNTVCKCIKQNQPAMSRITRYLFNVESPNFTRTPMPTESTGTRDMPSSINSGRDLSKFYKTVKNAAFDGFESNFNGAAFCLPRQLVGVLLLS